MGWFSPMRYSELPRFYRENLDGVDVVMMQCPPMDEHGNFSLSLAPSHLYDMCAKAKHIIVEVNTNMPKVFGLFKTEVNIQDVTYVVEGPNPSIPELGSVPPTDVDRTVANLIVPQIPNGACLQLGIGGMPNTVGALIAESDLKDLGVHTEMYVDAFVDIAKAGKINGKNKAVDYGREVFAFAAGPKKLYDYVNENPNVMGAPVDYTNDVRVIAQLDNFISINNIVDLDLFGQVNAESAVQGRQVLHLPVLLHEGQGRQLKIPHRAHPDQRLYLHRSPLYRAVSGDGVRHDQPQGSEHLAACRADHFHRPSSVP